MKTFTTGFFVLIIQSAFAQIDFTPYPGNITHCPGEEKDYTASYSGSGCSTPVWTITNGKIIEPETGNEVTTIAATTVSIKWDNVAATGKIRQNERRKT